MEIKDQLIGSGKKLKRKIIKEETTLDKKHRKQQSFETSQPRYSYPASIDYPCKPEYLWVIKNKDWSGQKHKKIHLITHRFHEAPKTESSAGQNLKSNSLSKLIC